MFVGLSLQEKKITAMTATQGFSIFSYVIGFFESY